MYAGKAAASAALQMDHKSPSPDMRGDRPSFSGCQHNQKICFRSEVQARSPFNNRLQVLIPSRTDGPNQRQPAQTCVQVFETGAKLASIRPQNQTDLGAFLDEV